MDGKNHEKTHVMCMMMEICNNFDDDAMESGEL